MFLRKREFCHIITKMVIVTVPLSNKANAEDTKAALAIANRIYEGTDLQEKFSSEIFNHYPTPWDWIADRIDMAFYKGVNVGDHIPWEATNGYKMKSEVAGVDTYHRYYAPDPVRHHIDFISRECWPDAIPFNLVNNNNGLESNPCPFKASNIYAKLNSLQMQVPNSAANNTTVTTVDYRTTGIYDKLPTALKNVITPKRISLQGRYTKDILLSNDNFSPWETIGPLWLPAENEVFSSEHYGSKNGFSSSGFVQYPIFANNMKMLKSRYGESVNCTLWLLTSAGGNSVNIVAVHPYGGAYTFPATYGNAHATICFRIEAKKAGQQQINQEVSTWISTKKKQG